MPDPQKTERATNKKRRDERKKGNVFLSSDAVSISVMVCGFAVLFITASNIANQVYSFLLYCVTLITDMVGKEIPSLELTQLFSNFIWSFVLAAGPFFLTCVVMAIGVTFFQTKMLFAPESIKPKFSKLNPIKGFAKLFSLKSVVEALKGILKIGLLLYIIFSYILSKTNLFSRYLHTDVRVAATHMFESAFGVIVNVSIAYVALAAFDIFYKKWEFERDMRMTKQEVKDEYKQLEGDPKIKRKIKETQRRMARSRMMQQVPKADVIIKNPTHYAVALRYKAEKDNAPLILAMGQNELAKRILQVGEENNITIIENKPLARALYATGKLYNEIPPDLYNAVAEVLVYIYKIKGKIT